MPQAKPYWSNVKLPGLSLLRRSSFSCEGRAAVTSWGVGFRGAESRTVPLSGTGARVKLSGFTLVELLLSAGLIAVILLAVSIFLSAMLSSRVKNLTTAEVEQQGAQVVQLITQDIRNAEAISWPTPGESAGYLWFNSADFSRNPVIYYLSGGAILIWESPGPSIPLTSPRVTASNMIVRNLSRDNTPDTIRIQFTLTYINPELRNEYDYSKTFYGSANLRQ